MSTHAASNNIPEPLRLATEKEADLVRQAALQLAEFLESEARERAVVRLTAEGVSEAVPLHVPVEILRFLARVLEQLAEGDAVTLVPYHKELTTQQAADLLNVSRPYLIKQLLDSGELAYHRVGNRRRIRFQDLMEYRRRDLERRKRVAKELTRAAEDLGLYDE